MKKAGFIKSFIVFVLIFALIFGAFKWGEKKLYWNTQATRYYTYAREEKDWIIGRQTPEGVILNRQEKSDEDKSQTVVPYFSSFAALGLLSGEVLERDKEAVLKYQNWYLDNINKDNTAPDGAGTIYNFTVTKSDKGNEIVSTQEYDSADSYSALFLMIIERYAEKVNEDVLHKRKDDILLVIDALLRTIKENSLSIAKESYPVQYLMDNCEVYGGLGATKDILTKLGMEEDRRYALVSLYEKELPKSINSLLWNEEKETYNVGLHKGNVIEFDSFESFYPDGVCQLFPIAFGVIEAKSPLATELYERFSKEWEWERMDMIEKDEASFYWCVISYVAALQGDEERLNEYISTYKEKLWEKGRRYPLHVGEAGWLAMASSYMADYYDSKMW